MTRRLAGAVLVLVVTTAGARADGLREELRLAEFLERSRSDAMVAVGYGRPWPDLPVEQSWVVAAAPLPWAMRSVGALSQREAGISRERRATVEISWGRVAAVGLGHTVFRVDRSVVATTTPWFARLASAWDAWHVEAELRSEGAEPEGSVLRRRLRVGFRGRDLDLGLHVVESRWGNAPRWEALLRLRPGAHGSLMLSTHGWGARIDLQWNVMRQEVVVSTHVQGERAGSFALQLRWRR